MERLIEALNAGRRMVFFGGAGVSTESGIPDFRSEQGIYHAVQTYGSPPEQILSHDFLLEHPETFFDFYKSRMLYPQARPNRAHTALAELERMGKLSAVITQNIDGLHQAAGSQNVLELHGSVLRNHCVDCGARYGLDAVSGALGVPRCNCGGMIRPDVVLYGEGLDQQVLSRSVQAIRTADVMIVGGTSLSVYPAAGLVHEFRGSALVVINQSATPVDGGATLLLRQKIGQALGDAVAAVRAGAQ